jgi:membrane protein
LELDGKGVATIGKQFDRGLLGILKSAFETFSETRASQAAAGLAYYAIFSIFPFLLFIIAIGSYFLDRQQAYQIATRLVQNALPVSSQLITENLKQVLSARGAVSVISLVTLLWSASGFFSNLAYNINLAWQGASRRNFFEKRLVGLGMIAGLGLLLLLSLTLDWVVPYLDALIASPLPLGLWRFFSILGSWLTIFLLFLALYAWVPTEGVYWSAALWGALVASVGWKVATSGFSWYIQSGLGKYQLVYGSLGAIVALLFLIFIMATVTLFGAHLSAAIDRWKEERS